jgi:hypothetical protein
VGTGVVGLVEKFVCVPGSGGKETGMVPILDTPGFSVSLGVGAIRKVKKFRQGYVYKMLGKSMGMAPHDLWWVWGKG